MNGLQEVSGVVMLTGEHVMTDSRKVAAAFGKRHDNVLRAIKKAIREAPDDSAKLNFEVCCEINELQNGKPQTFYLLTKDGFMAVALAFTGRKAAETRWRFIRAFNEMADFIRQQADGVQRRFDVAYLDFRHDQDHASQCGKDLARWRQTKMVHLARLERLNPQLRLPLIAREAA